MLEVNQQKASQVLWRILSSAGSAINHREHRRDQSAATIQKWLFEKSEKSVAPSIIFLWNLIGYHFVLGLNHHFSESCVFFVFLLFWNQEMFDTFIFDKIFWSAPTCKIKVCHSWKLKAFFAELTQLLLMTWWPIPGDKTIFEPIHRVLNHIIELSFICMHIDLWWIR